MQMQCDAKCGETFELTKLKKRSHTKTVDGRTIVVQETYFACPHCGYDYPVIFLDLKARNLQKRVHEAAQPLSEHIFQLEKVLAADPRYREAPHGDKNILTLLGGELSDAMLSVVNGLGDEASSKFSTVKREYAKVDSMKRQLSERSDRLKDICLAVG